MTTISSLCPLSSRHRPSPSQLQLDHPTCRDSLSLSDPEKTGHYARASPSHLVTTCPTEPSSLLDHLLPSHPMAPQPRADISATADKSSTVRTRRRRWASLATPDRS